MEHFSELYSLENFAEGSVPQDLKDANIITLYKYKGDQCDCNNYRGISLLGIASKLFARIFLHRLQTLAERIYPESQCGFRFQRSTVDMIFSVRQLQKKCREQNQHLYLAFIDLTNAFDLVSRDGLFRMLPLIGCPPKLLSIVKALYSLMVISPAILVSKVVSSKVACWHPPSLVFSSLCS